MAGYASTQDTEVRSGSSGSSFGNNTPISVDLSGSQGHQQGLIRFDNIFGTGAGQIPPRSTINSATLRVYVENGSVAGAQLTLHRMLVAWSESSTWDSLTNGIQFDGTDASATVDATIPDASATGNQTWSGANLTATVQAWSNGTTNRGWGIETNDATAWDFRSSETGTSAERPLLTIDYTPPIDLSLTKVVDDATPNVGSNVIFTITVTNAAGYSNATGVVVTDLLPSGYNHVGNTGGGAYAPLTGVWTVGNLAAGASRVLAITARVLPSGAYLNKAEVTAANQTDTDSTPNNAVTSEDDYAEQSTAPIATVDLSLTKTVDNATPIAGTNVVFTLTISNASFFSNASGVTVTDLLPSGYSYISDTGGASYTSGTGVWNVGNVLAGTNKVLSITARVLGTGIYLNKAEVTAATQPDADSTPNNGVTSEDDYAERSTAPIPRIDLVLTKTDNPDPAPAGGELLYDLLITNNGPSTATSVTLTDTLPGTVTFASATSNQGSCSGTTTVTCNLGGILNGGTASVQILVVTGGAGSITNNASVTATETDNVPGNNSASATTTVVSGGTTDIPLTLYRRVHGFIDSTVTGGTLRTQPNTGNPCLVGASSTAALAGIPAGATIVNAYLYWAGSGSTVDSSITLDAAALAADRTFVANYNVGGTNYDYFGGFKDITAQVTAKRNGNYTFGGLSVTTGNPYCAGQAVLAGWAMFVIYQDPAVTAKTLVLYDGFDITRNGTTSYNLAGIYASPPPEGKASFLVWEGDETLAGANESLVFNGSAISDALDPVNNVYNSTINSLGSSTSYGVDLDSFDVSSRIAPRDTLASAMVSTGPDLVILNAVLLQVKSNVIVGTVFEDVNYGGGAGRNFAAAGAAAPGFSIGRPGVALELYDALGNLIRTTTTDASGDYGFAGLADGNYTVRAVNGSVTSSRPGAVATLRAVQTYRVDASSGAAVAVTDEVGGASPKDPDAPANTTSANLSSFIAQSKIPAQIITGVAITNADFGYNFDTIVNVNDAGQGSLRQFLLNSNALTNAGLAQTGLTAGKETSLYMISNGAAHPGLRAGLPNLLTGGVAVIAPAAALPVITDADTTLDGGTQTTNVGDTNAGTLGTGGTVGVDALALATLAKPEVEIRDVRGSIVIPYGIDVQANNATLRNHSIWGFGNNRLSGFEGNVVVTNNASGVLVERNVLGSAAGSFSDPGAGARTEADDVVGGTGVTNLTVRDNLIGYTTYMGVLAVTGVAADNWLIQGNEIRSCGLGQTNQDGVSIESGSGGTTVLGNRIADTDGVGVDSPGSGGGNTIVNNTIVGNGVGGGASVETPGIRLFGAGNLVDRNIVQANFGAGVLVTSPSSGSRITRNSIYQNGTIPNRFGAPASGQIGIDLLAAADDQARGTAPFVTLNDSGDPDAGANTLYNDPVLTNATLIGTTLHVSGFARPGAVIEIFLADPDPSGFGEGKTFLFSAAEGGGSDTDAGNGSYGPGAINGVPQGADTTNRFAFSFVPAVAVVAGNAVTATATDASGNTSEFGGDTTVIRLGVIKRAFLTTGTPIPDASVLPRGTLVRFLLYVNNVANLVSDATLRDVLDPTFAYVAGSLRFSNTLARCTDVACTPAEEAAIFAAANTGSVGTDALDGDVVSFSAGSVHAGNQNVANAQLNFPASKVWALVFTVRMQ